MKKSSIYVISLLSFALFLLIIRLGWLAVGILLVGAIVYAFTTSIKLFVWIWQHTIVFTFFVLIGVFLLSITVRLSLFDLFLIPSSSMEDTLIPGDKIVVNKLSYGPRIPRSPFDIPWFNVLFYLNKGARAKADEYWWDYNRLSGYSNIKRDDIIVFNSSDNPKDILIKRCIGLPHDTIQIINGQTIINHLLHKRPVTCKVGYRIWYKSAEQFTSFAQNNNILAEKAWSKSSSFTEMSLSSVQCELLKFSGTIDSLVPILFKADSVPRTYPWDISLLWNVDEFGPVVVPQKGMSIPLTLNNYIIYKKIFENFENKPIVMSNGQFLLNGKRLNQYTFLKNYYFMMGDNRHNSSDSRVYGFVPEDCIFGKASLILYSFNTHKKNFLWNRLLNRIK